MSIPCTGLHSVHASKCHVDLFVNKEFKNQKSRTDAFYIQNKISEKTSISCHKMTSSECLTIGIFDENICVD